MKKKKDTNKLLPARRSITKSLAKFREFTDLVIPPVFKGSTALALTESAYQDYERGEHVGQTYSEILTGYDGALQVGATAPEEAEQEAETLLPIHQARLEQTLSRGTLEQYRIEAGLDKLRDQLTASLIQNVSFERGLEKLADLCVAKKLVERRTTERVLDQRDPHELSNKEKVQICFPDITAEDVAWLSLTRVERSGILYSQEAPLFYPVTLVDMDIDGLQFSYGTIDETRTSSIQANSVSQLVGLTGASESYRLVPFEHNVAQAIKAIVLLSINDDDLFQRIWSEQQDTPIRRGDAILVKTFLAQSRPDVDWAKGTSDLLYDGTISRVEIDRARLEIRAYASSKVQILDGPVKTTVDFLKLIGLLERVPEFVEQQERFKGYIKLYGTSVEFINDIGVVVESVPLHGHLLLSTSYQFHDQITDISRRNRVVDKLLAQLRKAIYSEIVDNDHQMLIDSFQASLFENYGVFVPTTVSKRVRQYTAIEMLQAHLRESEIVERTLKFSYRELQLLDQILSCLPRGALRDVGSITKEISHAATLSSLRTGAIKAASYNPVTKQICISLPFETPYDRDDITLVLESVMAAPSQRRGIVNTAQSVHLHHAYFTHALLHEVGESLWAAMPDELKTTWAQLGDGGCSLREVFLTPYAKEAPNEDFCECFAIYHTHGDTFRSRAEQYPILHLKYDFVHRLWGADGENREADLDFSHLSLAEIHGNPEDDVVSLSLHRALQEEMASEIWMRNAERQAFASKVLSYEELEERALEDEDEQDPIGKAARGFDTSEGEDAWAERQSRFKIIRLVEIKTQQALIDLKINALYVDSALHEALKQGQAQEAKDILKAAGAKSKSKISKTVNRLIRLYAYFADYLVTPQEEAETTKESNDRTTALISGLAEHQARQNQ